MVATRGRPCPTNFSRPQRPRVAGNGTKSQRCRGRLTTSMLGVAPEAKGPPVKVHHLNCGTMNAFGIALLCHVLLVETDDGLVLVDTGFGIRTALTPAG